MSDLEELPARLIELRQLIGEAHEVIADMDRLLRQLREQSSGAAAQMRKDTEKTANDLLGELSRHLQAQQNQASADLNRAVDKARRLIVKSLTMTRFQPDGKGGYAVTWARGRFDDAVGLPPAKTGDSDPVRAVIPPGLRRHRKREQS